MITPNTPKMIPITKHTAPTIIEIQANIFACLAALVAPSISPAAAFLFTCMTKINETTPCGRQQARETTVATIARIMLFGTAAAALEDVGGVNGCDISMLLITFCFQPARKYACRQRSDRLR